MRQSQTFTVEQAVARIQSDLRAGKTGSALHIAEQVTRKIPDHADGWAELAKCLLVAGRTGGLASARRCLILDPRNAEGHLGAYSVQEGSDPRAANRALRRVIAAHPTLQKALDIAAISRRTVGSDREADAAAKRPALLAPGRAQSWTLRGDLLLGWGASAEAALVYKRALMIQPHEAKAFYSLAITAPRDVPGTLLADAIARSSGTSIPLQDLDLNAFAIATCLDRQDETARAMTWFIIANRAHRQSHPSQNEANRRIVSACLDTAWRSDPAIARADGELRAPIFIVGVPGAGTTLIENILSMHDAIEAGGEFPYIGQMALTLPGYPVAVPSLPEDRLRALATQYRSNVKERVQGDGRFVTDKMPSNFFHIGLIRAVFPQAPIIHATRDPMALGWSLFRRRFTEGQSFAYDLEDIAEFVSLEKRLMAHWSTLWPGVIHEVRYEALIDGTEAEVRRLLAYLGLEWDAACLNFHRAERRVATASALQVRQPITTSAKDRWRRYEAHLEPLRLALERFEARSDATASGRP